MVCRAVSYTAFKLNREELCNAVFAAETVYLQTHCVGLVSIGC